MHRLQEVVRLHRQGTSVREASRLLGMSRNTAGCYVTALRAAGLLEGAVETLPELAELRAALPANVPPLQTSSIEVWASRAVADRANPRLSGAFRALRSLAPNSVNHHR